MKHYEAGGFKVGDWVKVVIYGSKGWVNEGRGMVLEVDFNRTAVNLDKYPVPTVFRLGASIKPIDKNDQSLKVAIQLEHPNDNSENIRIGVEYAYLNLIFLRTGYKINVLGQKAPTFGAGFKPKLGRNALMVNYALNITQYLGNIHSFGIDVGINTTKRE